MAFENAFRIQVIRNQESKLPIYQETPVVLASEATLNAQVDARLRAQHRHPATLTEDERYELITYFRVDEAKRLAALFPMHALMAILRSGNTEWIPESEQGLVSDLLDELKERTNTLDNDAFDDGEAQERFHEFFETLHYVIEGLTMPIMDEAVWSLRNELLNLWGSEVEDDDGHAYKAVADSESGSWNVFRQNLDYYAQNDRNLLVGIAYTLTSRLLKERESESIRHAKRWRNLQPQPHTRGQIHADRYLRDANRQGTTTVTQLKVAYQKYFDLLREFSARFPGIRLLSDRNIYILLENTVNFRQTVREVDLLLRHTTGRIYLINVGDRHPGFSKRLKKGISERFSWSDRQRIRVRDLEFTMEGRLRNDKEGVIFSSASPIEWRNVGRKLGNQGSWRQSAFEIRAGGRAPECSGPRAAGCPAKCRGTSYRGRIFTPGESKETASSS